MMMAATDTTTATLIPSLQKASKNWKTFDWDSKATEWNEALESSRQSREAAQVARKQLAETTKTFKKVRTKDNKAENYSDN
jgi:hypothetical protein